MNRKEQMDALAASLTETIKTFGRRHDVTVEYSCFDTMEDVAANFTPWQMYYHGIKSGIEYFLIYEPDPETGRHLLYTVNVSRDSCLTAASELMDLASRKGL